MFVLRKTINEDDGDRYVVDVAVSNSEEELVALRDRCIAFETQDQDDIVVKDHPAGLIGNSFRYLEGYVSYGLLAFDFEDDMEESVFEAQMKAKMSIETEKLTQLLIRNEDL